VVTMPVSTDAFRELVPGDRQLTRLCTGFRFTEGPVWSGSGQFLLFSDIPANTRYRWDENGGATVVKQPSHKCNGMTYEADGSLLVCEHETSRVVRERADGSAEVVASHFQGRQLNSPNDIVAAHDGAIYFTDPTYGRTADFGRQREADLPFRGLYRLRPGSAEPELLDDTMGQPNGLCFAPGEAVLYVNDTTGALIRAFDVNVDGSLGPGRVLCSEIGTGLPGGPNPDGMKCDDRGTIYVTGPGGIWVISPDGSPQGVLPVPEKVGNLNWGGPDWRSLFICASTSVYRIELETRGNPLGYMTQPPREQAEETA
jgi:gluconolactonase